MSAAPLEDSRLKHVKDAGYPSMNVFVAREHHLFAAFTWRA